MFPIISPPSYLSGMRETNAYTSDLQNMLMNRLAQQHEATNLKYLSPMLQEQLRASQLANQISGAQAPYAGPLAKAQLGYLQGQGNMLGLQGQHLAASKPYWPKEAETNQAILQNQQKGLEQDISQKQLYLKQYPTLLQQQVDSGQLTNEQAKIRKNNLQDQINAELEQSKANLTQVKEANKLAYEQRLEGFGPQGFGESILHPKLWWTGGNADYRNKMQAIEMAKQQQALEAAKLANAGSHMNLSYQQPQLEQSLANQQATGAAIPMQAQTGLMNAITNQQKLSPENVLPRYINNPTFNTLMNQDPAVAESVRNVMTATAMKAGQLAGTPAGNINNMVATILPEVAAKPNEPLTNDKLDDMIKKAMPGITSEKLREIHNVIVEKLKEQSK